MMRQLKNTTTFNIALFLFLASLNILRVILILLSVILSQQAKNLNKKNG